MLSFIEPSDCFLENYSIFGLREGNWRWWVKAVGFESASFPRVAEEQRRVCVCNYRFWIGQLLLKWQIGLIRIPYLPFLKMHFFARFFPEEARGLCRLGRSVPSVKLAEWCVDLLTALNSQTLQPRKNKLIFGINAVVQSLIAIGNALVPLFQNLNEIMEAFLLHQFILFPEFGELEGGKLPWAEEQTDVVVPERGFLGGYYVLEGSVHIILFLEHWLYDASDWLMVITMFRRSLGSPRSGSSFLPSPASSSPAEAQPAACPRNGPMSPKACIFGITASKILTLLRPNCKLPCWRPWGWIAPLSKRSFPGGKTSKWQVGYTYSLIFLAYWNSRIWQREWQEYPCVWVTSQGVDNQS